MQQTLVEYARTTWREVRDVEPKYARQVIRHCELFETTMGPQPLESLTDTLVNEFVALISASNGRSPRTIKSIRDSVLAVWRDAWRAGYVETRPERVRAVRCPRVQPRAWTIDEIRRLVAACRVLPGYVSQTRTPRSVWFTAWVQVHYYTGLRSGDVLRLTEDNLTSQGIVSLIQHKTGQPIVRRIPQETVALIRHTKDNGLLLPWPGAHGRRLEWFQRAVRIAGIRPGSCKWIRRTAASYVERDHPGEGGRFLGHQTQGLAERHYLDPAITAANVRMPPKL